MVSKCANPNCSSTFLHLSDGKLFRVDTESRLLNHAEFGADPAVRKPARHIEFFWLCNNCARSMTLGFRKGIGVVPVDLPGRSYAASGARA
jgi:hypothetical protein